MSAGGLDALGATEPRRRSKRRLKAAQFPRDKPVRSFDFDANPNAP